MWQKNITKRDSKIYKYLNTYNHNYRFLLVLGKDPVNEC